MYVWALLPVQYHREDFAAAHRPRSLPAWPGRIQENDDAALSSNWWYSGYGNGGNTNRIYTTIRTTTILWNIYELWHWNNGKCRKCMNVFLNHKVMMLNTPRFLLCYIKDMSSFFCHKTNFTRIIFLVYASSSNYSACTSSTLMYLLFAIVTHNVTCLGQLWLTSIVLVCFMISIYLQ